MGIYDNLTATAPLPAKTWPVLLIVDDEAGPRESLRMVFKDRYQCVLAHCGREGLEYARLHQVDAAVLDIRMPDLSGIEVLRELKQIDPHIECVMLTGYETIETARAAVQHGAADYLNKPFDVFAMRDLLAKCMERRRQRVQMEANYEKVRALNEELTHEISNHQRAASANAMSTGVVHELNNPLAIISAYAQMLERDLHALRSGGKVAVEELQDRVGSLSREIERCREVTRRFLRLARTTEQDVETVDVAHLLEDSAALIKAHPANRQATICVTTPETPLSIRGQPGLLLQILLNLGINALQAMQGEGRLEFSASSASIPADCVFRAAALDAAKPHLCIRVADSGPGIAPAILAQIFTPYFTTKTSGNGLGLAIIADLVGRHHGAINVASQVGTGTVFSVYLPVAN